MHLIMPCNVAPFSVIARHGKPLRSVCLISTNASAATCCILLNAKAYVSNSILAISTVIAVRALSQVAGGAVLGEILEELEPS